MRVRVPVELPRLAFDEQHGARLELDALVVGDGLAVEEDGAAAVAVHVGDEQIIASLLEGGDAQLEEASPFCWHRAVRSIGLVGQ